MNANDFIAWLLRSPFHGLLSSGTMLLTVIGRKTGNQYTTPVDYYEENGFCGCSAAGIAAGGETCKAMAPQ